MHTFIGSVGGVNTWLLVFLPAVVKVLKNCRGVVWWDVYSRTPAWLPIGSAFYSPIGI